MSSAVAAEQQRVAAGVVARIVGVGRSHDEAAVAVLAVSGGNALGDDGRTRVLADVDHLRARVRLLVVVGHGHAVELRYGVVAAQQTRGVFPRDGRSRLHLCPGEFGVVAAQVATLRYEIEHTAPSVFVAWIPVLDGGVFHLGPVHDDDLDDGRMELVLVAHWGRAALQVGDVGVVVGHDERALKLSRVAGVDAEIAAQFHRAAYALGDIDEGSVGEHRRVERGKEVVAVGDDRAQILPDEVRVGLYGLADGAEDHALLPQFLLECGLDRHGVHDRIDRRAAQCEPLLQGNAQFVESLLQFGVYLLVLRLLRQRVCVVGDGLIVDGRDVHMSPCGLLERLPVAEGAQAKLQHPFGLVLLL